MARFVAGRRSDGVGQRSQAARAAWVRNVEVTRARRAMKNGLIVETMMISRTERKPAFSTRTGFSVSTRDLTHDLPVVAMEARERVRGGDICHVLCCAGSSHARPLPATRPLGGATLRVRARRQWPRGVVRRSFCGVRRLRSFPDSIQTYLNDSMRFVRAGNGHRRA